MLAVLERFKNQLAALLIALLAVWVGLEVTVLVLDLDGSQVEALTMIRGWVGAGAAFVGAAFAAAVTQALRTDRDGDGASALTDRDDNDPGVQ